MHLVADPSREAHMERLHSSHCLKGNFFKPSQDWVVNYRDWTACRTDGTIFSTRRGEGGSELHLLGTKMACLLRSWPPGGCRLSWVGEAWDHPGRSWACGCQECIRTVKSEGGLLCSSELQQSVSSVDRYGRVGFGACRSRSTDLDPYSCLPEWVRGRPEKKYHVISLILPWI